MIYRGVSIVDSASAQEISGALAASSRKYFILLNVTTVLALFLILVPRHLGDGPDGIRHALLFFAATAVLLTLICILGAFRARKKIADRLFAQVQTTHHTDHLSRTIEVEDNKVRILSDQTEKELWLEDLEKCFCTQNQIILWMKGAIILWIAKEGLEGGTPEDLFAHFQSYLPKKK